MTTPIPGDNDALSDPRVEAAWRAASREEPPAQLDTAILAAARRAVAAAPRSAGAQQALADRRRWWPLAAAATVAVLAIGVLQITPPVELGAPASEKGMITDLPAPNMKPESDELKTAPREDKQKNDVTADRMTRRGEAAQNSVTPDRATRLGEGPTNSVAVERVTGSDKATRNSVTAGSATSRLEGAKEIASVERTTTRADDARAPSGNFDSKPPPSTLASATPESAISKKTPYPEPFPAASPPSDSASSAAKSAPAAPALTGKLAAPVMAQEKRQALEGQESASVGRLTMKDSAGGPATILTQPPQRAAASAAMPDVAQSTPALPSPISPMAKSRDPESETDRARADNRAPPLSVAEWIVLIRRLRDEGNIRDAAKELAAFRAAHGDHEKLLPRDLVEWRPAAN